MSMLLISSPMTCYLLYQFAVVHMSGYALLFYPYILLVLPLQKGRCCCFCCFYVLLSMMLLIFSPITYLLFANFGDFSISGNSMFIIIYLWFLPFSCSVFATVNIQTLILLMIFYSSNRLIFSVFANFSDFAQSGDFSITIIYLCNFLLYCFVLFMSLFQTYVWCCFCCQSFLFLMLLLVFFWQLILLFAIFSDFDLFVYLFLVAICLH